ncbi:hypothetical protein QN386_06945 [Pseudomonas sp. CCI3.2]|uniref:hypothetical protein n=1 Tax=unclassified Pseudomonas TaxID=196821 RepID=UPI002B2364A9|nr:MULTISPECIES: hypothetical protein [unclassified Pseudomonas]MEB0076298.1 hypothetical protein [Pseudomonas sp. MH10out]MEB0101063.1 hypothetical protein [Pseudomonas sp. CCI3.2]MEB0128922.1 hypothetical protein [Pseudomonas sp. CCI2.4]
MKKITDTNPPPDSATMHEAARCMYESTPATLDAIAMEFGVSARTLKRWSQAAGGWQKLASPTITARAQLAADRVQTAAANLSPDAPAEYQESALAELRIDTAVDERAAVLVKHRGEFNIVRGLVGEAVRSRDAGKARLAVDVGRALELCHRNERRAWGLDVESPGGTVVVIDRS